MTPALELSDACDGVDWAALKRALAADDFDNGRTPLQLEQAFRASAAVVFARHRDAVIGTGRALSDGVSNAYVLDVWTSSRWRRRGVGRRMLQRLTQRFEGQHVYLFTDDREDFYLACGYRRRGVGLERIVGTWLDGGGAR